MLSTQKSTLLQKAKSFFANMWLRDWSICLRKPQSQDLDCVKGVSHFYRSKTVTFQTQVTFLAINDSIKDNLIIQQLKIAAIIN